MIEVVRSIDAYHTIHVSNANDLLIINGYEVESIERISKMRFGIFGEDVTHIKYNKPNQGK